MINVGLGMLVANLKININGIRIAFYLIKSKVLITGIDMSSYTMSDVSAFVIMLQSHQRVKTGT